MIQARPQTVQVNQANPMKKTHGETHYEDTTHAQPQLTVSRAPHRNTETGFVRLIGGVSSSLNFPQPLWGFLLQEVALGVETQIWVPILSTQKRKNQETNACPGSIFRT